MPIKSIYQPIYELALSVCITFSALLCIFPSEALFSKWWEDHTFAIILATLTLGLFFFCANYKYAMFCSFGACAALCLLLQDRTQAPLGRPEKNGEAIVRVTQMTMPEMDENWEKNLKAILATKSDLISIQAVLFSQLSNLHEFFTCCGYPYYELAADSANQTAIVVYSRYPFNFVGAAAFPNAPGWLGRIEVSTGEETHELYFFSAFLEPAMQETDYQKRRERLQAFAYQLNHIKAPLLACGDYNLVTWSKDLQLFKAYAHLNDSRRNVMTTSQQGRLSFWDYPFDHIFYSNHFKCIKFETISSVATPHLGIVGTYQFQTQASLNNAKTASQKL